MVDIKKALAAVTAAVSAAVVLAGCGSGSTSSAGATSSPISSPISTPNVSDADVRAFLVDAYGGKVDPATLDPVVVAAAKTAAQPVTSEQEAKLLECYKALSTCDLGRAGITVGIAEPNIKQSPYRQIAIAQYLLQAIQTPEIGKVIITDGHGDLQSSLANFSSLVSQRVSAIVGNLDYADSMGGVGKQAAAAGIPVVAVAQPIPGLEPGKQQWFVGTDGCHIGAGNVKAAIAAAGTKAGTIGLYTGPPGNPFAAQWVPCAEKTAKEAGWNTTLGYTQWTPQGMEQAASQLVASGQHLDAIASDLALSPGFLDKLLNSGGPVPVTVGSSYTVQQVQKCLSSPKFHCIMGTSAGVQHRIAITAAAMLTHGQNVSPNITVELGYLTPQELIKQVDIDRLPPDGQFNMGLSPELQTALANDQ